MSPGSPPARLWVAVDAVTLLGTADPAVTGATVTQTAELDIP